jgi:hypothetical protein
MAVPPETLLGYAYFLLHESTSPRLTLCLLYLVLFLHSTMPGVREVCLSRAYCV